MGFATEEELKAVNIKLVELQKKMTDIVNTQMKILNDYADGIHDTSTTNIKSLNNAVMEMSTDIYKEG